jgi:DNA-binding beta-propeller fold protein YncE
MKSIRRESKVRKHSLLVCVAGVGLAAAAAATAAVSVGMLKILGTAKVPFQPGPGVHMSVSSGKGAVWVGDGRGTVTRIDPKTRTAVATIDVKDLSLVGAGAAGDWAATSDRTTVRIDPATNQIAETVRTRTKAYPIGIAVDAKSLWITGADSATVTRVDARSGKVVAEIPAASAHGIAVGARAVWAASMDSLTVYRIDPARNKVVAKVVMKGTPLAIAASAHAVWVFDGTNNAIVRLDPRTLKVVTMTPLGKALGVPYTASLAVDGKSLWATTGTHVARFDLRTGKLLAAVAVGHHAGGQPEGLENVSSGPAGVWVADGDGRAVSQIAP